MYCCLQDSASCHFVARKAKKKKCDRTQHCIDNIILENGDAIHLYEHQHDVDNCDDLLTSLEGSALDHLNGNDIIIVFISI